jgi:hypothetical protein
LYDKVAFGDIRYSFDYMIFPLGSLVVYDESILRREFLNKKIIMKFLIALTLAITTTALHAQNLTVSVKFDNNDPVGYAYISINNKIIAATDSVGVALIPIDKINLQDTIAAYFVGYGRESVLITDEVKREMACDIILTRTYDMDEIVVVGPVDTEALYKKYTVSLPFYHYATTNDLAYKYVIKKNNSSVDSGEGNLSLVYI